MFFKISGMFICIILTLSGCTIVDGSSVVVGEQRQPSNVEDIRLFRKAPENYQEIALVSASAGHDFKSDSDLLKEALDRLKMEASKVGANGVLLTEIRERSGSVTTFSVIGANASSNSVGVVSTGDRFTRVKGLAIFINN